MKYKVGDRVLVPVFVDGVAGTKPGIIHNCDCYYPKWPLYYVKFEDVHHDGPWYLEHRMQLDKRYYRDLKIMEVYYGTKSM
jgi:hypothetical protein